MTRLLTAAASAALLVSAPAAAETLRITVTNLQGTGGLAITPLYTAFHDETVDLFDLGAEASPGIAEIAETGDFGPLRGERLAIQGDSQGVGIGSPSGPPPIQPGETESVEIDVNGDVNRFFSYFAMVLPSNDTFIGVDDPTSIELFGEDGSFLGPQVITVTGLDIYDAGSEANDFENGPAFVEGQDIDLGGPGEGSIAQNVPLGLIPPEGIPLLPGGVLTPEGADFISDPANFALLEISIEAVGPAAVPLPASALLLLSGLGALAVGARRR